MMADADDQDLAASVERMLYGEVDRAQRAVADRLLAARAAPTTDASLAGALTSEVLVAGELPDDLDQRIEAQRTTNLRAHEAVETLTRVAEQLDRVRADRAVSGASDALELVRDELDAVVSGARDALAALPAEVDSADSAIEADCVDQWRKVLGFVVRYGEVREVQNNIVSGAARSSDPSYLAPLYGHVTDPDRYVDVRAYVTATNLPRRAHELTGEPIPSPILPWWEGDPIEVLRFVTRPDVELWVPTMDELRAYQKEVDARNRPNESSPTTPAQIRDAWVEKGEWGPAERPTMLTKGT